MSNQSTEFQNHLTIILGPPDQKAIEQNTGNWTNVTNDSLDNLWIQYVSSFAEILAKHKAPNYISELERLFAVVLNEPIRLERISVGKTCTRELVVPKIIIYESDLTDINEAPFPMKWFCEDTRFLIGHYINLLIKSKWIHISTSLAI